MPAQVTRSCCRRLSRKSGLPRTWPRISAPISRRSEGTFPSRLKYLSQPLRGESLRSNSSEQHNALDVGPASETFQTQLAPFPVQMPKLAVAVGCERNSSREKIAVDDDRLASRVGIPC